MISEAPISGVQSFAPSRAASAHESCVRAGTPAFSARASGADVDIDDPQIKQHSINKHEATAHEHKQQRDQRSCRRPADVPARACARLDGRLNPKP